MATCRVDSAVRGVGDIWRFRGQRLSVLFLHPPFEPRYCVSIRRRCIIASAGNVETSELTCSTLSGNCFFLFFFSFFLWLRPIHGEGGRA